MPRRELTFYCHRPLTIPQARQLRRLGGMFRARLCLINLSRRQQGDPAQLLALLSAAARQGDLCQLVIEGADAELAHMVLTSWVTELGHLLGGKRPGFAQAQSRLERALPGYRLTPAMVSERPDPLTKEQALAHLVGRLPADILTDPEQLFRQLQEREQISPTLIRAGLAMPHVLSEAVQAPALTLLQSPLGLEWGSPLGPVNTLILMAAPRALPPERLRPLPTLVQNLLGETLGPALLRASSASARHAILVEGLTTWVTL
ncbi:PTS sugar transporter subunit IIA [Aeromonas schubertii]|uniref:PTS sugar transporter subunit IIA n=1 Tax=Aeromonas schubertii TaxID=652 RepID=UPI001CC3C468|nr:PTS sugar transporter subunit IIA [Aeromonas schubertii]MBZ6070913.1 PTS sugar transporter subunit IIA [Aeromonas schubertii]